MHPAVGAAAAGADADRGTPATCAGTIAITALDGYARTAAGDIQAGPLHRHVTGRDDLPLR